MTNPEMTKKTSTPTKPPVIPGTLAWYRTTSSTATARSPSTSGRNGRSLGAVPASLPVTADSSPSAIGTPIRPG